MMSLRSVQPVVHEREHLDIEALEEVLACNIKDVIADFCLTDAEIIRFYVDNQLHGNMDEMVTSSAELYFKGETLSYGYVAHVSPGREETSCVVLDMEFVHETLTVQFQLVFGSCYIGVKINEVLRDGSSGTEVLTPASFARILSSARLRPLPSRFQTPYCLGESTRH